MGYLPELDMVPMPGATPARGESVSVVENLMLGLVDGKLTVAQIGEACGVDHPLAQRIMSKLQTAGCVKFNVGGEYDVAASGVTAAEDAVEQLYLQLEKMNYYEMLGVSPLADRVTIRNAYFALSKKYHPDTQFSADNIHVKQKLSRIFDRITIAYETLAGKSKRQQYDETIADQIEMWKLENQLKQAARQTTNTASQESAGGSVAESRVGETRTSQPSGARSASSGGRPTPDPARTSYRRTPVQDNVSVGAGARISRIPITRTSYTAQSTTESIPDGTPSQVFGRTSSAAARAVTSSVPVGGSTSMTPEEREQRRQKWKRDRLKKALGSTGVSPSGIRTSATTAAQSDSRLLEHARIAIEHQEFDHAVQYLQEVLRRDGENSAASILLHKAQSGRVNAQVNNLIRQGRFEQSRGNANNALELYERALKLDSRHIEAMHHVAGALLDTGKDWSRALKLSRDVVGKGGNRASHFAVLAELLAKKGEVAKAIEMMNRAADMAPDNKEYKKRLKAMKK
ncbi:MAG: DnaJ domain-containing protein [Deltaproteobacteria bacterium]|nr:DnaJ domain-containing protein [Deltaproteobacteria bacterium]MBN2673130.1 DnaJ domain-containing protein [Deltaproteobacteria bacterium]